MKKWAAWVPALVGVFFWFQAGQFWSAAKSVLHQNLAVNLILVGAILIAGSVVAAAVLERAQSFEVVSKDEIQGGE